jgi:antirestriction protein ArdC
MPKIETFENSESYYGTIFHEFYADIGIKVIVQDIPID